MSHNGAVSRRRFLAAGALTTTALAFSAKSYAQILGANERIGVAFVGAGGMGTNHLNACKALSATTT